MNEVQSISFNVGALSNATRPVWKIPSGYSGVTIIGAQASLGGVGTSEIYITEMDSAGTVNNGTVASFGTVFATNVPKEATVTGARSFIDAGNFVGIKENNVGAMATVSIITINYVVGKGEY